MRSLLAAVALIALAGTALARDGGGPVDQPLLHEVAGDVRAEALHDTIAKLVSFGTRHTASETQSETRGIGAARRWVKAQFEALNQNCHCLQIVTPSQVVTAERLPKPTEVMDVLAIQRGTSDPDRVIVISGHLDSRVSDVMNATSDAPGADDDGSGVAAVMEAARVLSRHKFPATLVFAVLSGEEQGLHGGKILAAYAKEHHWQVEAQLNNDIVGNTLGTNGVREDGYVRVFSEGTRALETPDQAKRRRYNGGEVDSPSRNLARFIDALADRYGRGFKVRMIYRTDRFSRGGDQVPMLEAGFPAVRFTESIENYTREHQDLRTENGIKYGDVLEAVDFDYLAQVTRVNVVAMAALAAPAPPTNVTIEGAVSHNTTVKWTPVPGAVAHRVWWRETTAPQWTNNQMARDPGMTVLEAINIDDWFFGVSSISADGYESPIEFPGPAGAFINATEPAPAR
jgi:acetylornithine deacetylase/succinyl-diaminopimelate desuccinylase-like protein